MQGVSRVLVALAPAALAGCATPSVSALEADLAARPSATAVLQARCAEPIRAVRLQNPRIAIPLPDFPQAGGYRHVQLRCGERTMSEAWNWYDPALLTPSMNETLDSSDRPFGAVAGPLGFVRNRIATRRGAALGCPAGTVLSQMGELRLPGGERLALLLECYTRAALTSAPAG